MNRCQLLRTLSWGYLGVLFAWLAAYLATGDRFGYLGLVNLLAIYLFYPLPLVLLNAAICRSRGLGAGVLLGALAFLWLWGGLLLPRPSRASGAGDTITVMTFNVLAYHKFTEPIVATIRAENPDLVFLQELNLNLAAVLEDELGEQYPFQYHEPANSASGIGVISKYPLRPTGEDMSDHWIGGPILLTMDWNGQTVQLVNFHMYPTTGLASQEAISRNFRTREEQARRLTAYAQGKGPAILGGDANSGPLSDAYRIFTRDLQDAWSAAGAGLGHTFPGSDLPFSDRPRIGPWYVPPWLVRIDYIFHSSHWETVSAHLAVIDGVSDHRGVVAVLRLK